MILYDIIGYYMILWNYNVPQVWNSFANIEYNYGMNGNYMEYMVFRDLENIWKLY